MSYRIHLLASLSTIALAACGSSSDQVYLSPDLDSTARVFADTTGDAGDALADGETLVARSDTTSGITLNYDAESGGPTAFVKNPNLSVTMNEDGELTLFIEGQEQAFTAADYDANGDGTIYGYFTREQCDTIGICNNLFSYSGTLDDFKASGNGYHKIFLAQTNQLFDDGGLNLRAYGVAGTETRDAALAGLSSVSYSGRSRIDVYPTTGFVDNGTSRTRLSSDVAINADFGAGTISGTMTNFESRGPGEADWSPVAGSVAMTASSFAGNGFEGKLAPDAAWTEDTGATFGGTYSGAFFGPAAEEVAGSISASGTDDDIGSFNAIGFFSTSTAD